MKNSILKTFRSWLPKVKKPETIKSTATIPETPKEIDYKKWFNQNNGQ